VAGALLAGAVDYAGLFPPASLDLPTTLANYLEYRASPEAWALGRLVVPAGRLAELASLLPTPAGPERIQVAALLGAGAPEDALAIARFHRDGPRHGALVSAVEFAPGVTSGDQLTGMLRRYFEIPVEQVTEAALDPVETLGGSVKLRTGGVTAAAFPSAAALARALALLGRRRISFKATAGLHHPLRGPYRLTYAEGAPAGLMFGYLDLMMAALLAWGGEPVREIEAALLLSDAGAISADPGGLEFLGRRYSPIELGEMRRDVFHGFGSCSFREPLDEWPLPEVR
jgi:hypothetical protein